MKIVKISEVCDVIAGQSPPSTTYNTTGDGLPFFQGKADFGYLFPNVRYWCNAPQKISLPNDILISVRAPVGPTNINTEKSCIGRGLSAIRCSDTIDTKFLLFYLRSIEFKMADKANGSTFSAITQKDLLNIEIPLPPLSTQQKIAAILDAADAYRQKTKTLIEKYDQLAQSLFLEMFDNSGREYSFNDIADKSNKGTFSNGPFGSDLLTSELTTSGVPVVYIRDIRNGVFAWKSNVYITLKKAEELKNCQVIVNDVLIAKVGDPPGIAALYTGNSEMAVITQDVIRIRVNTKIVSPKFIQFWFNSHLGKISLKPIIVDGTRKRFGLGDLKKIKIIIPPITLQTQFAERIQLIEAQKQQAQASLQKAEELFNSLLQRAFKGELVA